MKQDYKEEMHEFKGHRKRGKFRQPSSEKNGSEKQNYYRNKITLHQPDKHGKKWSAT